MLPLAVRDLSVPHQMHALMCAENAMITSSRPSLALEGPTGELFSHSSMKSGSLSRRINRSRRTRRSERSSFVDLVGRNRRFTFNAIISSGGGGGGDGDGDNGGVDISTCLLYTSPSPRD